MPKRFANQNCCNDKNLHKLLGNLMELLFRGLLMEAEQKKVAREQMVDQAIEQAVAQEILMTLLGEQ